LGSWSLLLDVDAERPGFVARERREHGCPGEDEVVPRGRRVGDDAFRDGTPLDPARSRRRRRSGYGGLRRGGASPFEGEPEPAVADVGAALGVLEEREELSREVSQVLVRAQSHRLRTGPPLATGHHVIPRTGSWCHRAA